jgi:hypothetical protein
MTTMAIFRILQASSPPSADLNGRVVSVTLKRLQLLRIVAD